jgi:hypothetical protein
MIIRVVRKDAEEVGELCTMRNGEKVRFPYFSSKDIIEINLNEFSDWNYVTDKLDQFITSKMEEKR